MNRIQIVKSVAREILDSRGDPTLEVSVFLSDGSIGIAGVPSGASTGSFEAHELRDREAGGGRYHGKGVQNAVYNVNRLISPAISGITATDQDEIDHTLLSLDGTENKEKLGANAMLGVSLAAARAAAVSLGVPLFRYIGGVSAKTLPVPMMNILNGGAHAGNNIDIQEFMIVPLGAENIFEGVRMCSEIYGELGKKLRGMGANVSVGDEGGYAPDLKNEREALDIICGAVESAGYSTDTVKIALDAAASEWQTEGGYLLPKAGRMATTEELIELWAELCGDYPIISIEDGLGESDFKGWEKLTARLGKNVMLVGDDLFVTNEQRLKIGVYSGAGNAILIKPNQIGTLSETLAVIAVAQSAGYEHIVSHRSGETDDTTIADLAVGSNARYIKAGAPCRGERVAKYNRLMKIASSISRGARYGE